MDITPSEIANSIEERRKYFFPSSRIAFLCALSLVSGASVSFNFISPTVGILIILVYLGGMIAQTLEGIFEQLAMLRNECARDRERRDKSGDILFEKINDVIDFQEKHKA